MGVCRVSRTPLLDILLSSGKGVESGSNSMGNDPDTATMNAWILQMT